MADQQKYEDQYRESNSAYKAEDAAYKAEQANAAPGTMVRLLAQLNIDTRPRHADLAASFCYADPARPHGPCSRTNAQSVNFR